MMLVQKSLGKKNYRKALYVRCRVHSSNMQVVLHVSNFIKIIFIFKVGFISELIFVFDFCWKWFWFQKKFCFLNIFGPKKIISPKKSGIKNWSKKTWGPKVFRNEKFESKKNWVTFKSEFKNSLIQFWFSDQVDHIKLTRSLRSDQGNGIKLLR